MKFCFVATLAVITLFFSSAVWSAGEFDQFDSALRAQDYTAAQQSLNQLSQAAETSQALREKIDFYSIKLLFAQGMNEQARAGIAVLRSQHPDHPALDDLDFADGLALMGEHKWDAAIIKFQVLGASQSPYATEARRRVQWVQESKLYDTAESERNQRHFQEAQLQYNEFAAKYPSHPQAAAARFYAIKMLYQMNEFDNAIAKVQAELSAGSHSYDDELYLLMAESYIRKRDIATARQLMDNFNQRFPNSNLHVEAEHILIETFAQALPKPGTSDFDRFSKLLDRGLGDAVAHDKPVYTVTDADLTFRLLQSEGKMDECDARMQSLVGLLDKEHPDRADKVFENYVRSLLANANGKTSAVRAIETRVTQNLGPERLARVHKLGQDLGIASVSGNKVAGDAK